MSKLSDNMETRFVLCSIETRAWTGQMTDSATSHEVTSNKKAASDAGKFVKVLVKSSALARIRNAAGRARAVLYGGSVPWLSSSHLVKAERMGDINKQISECKTEFDSAVAQFIEEYPRLLEGAAARLGELFNAADYPAASALPSKFSFAVTWYPFTQASPAMLAAFDAEAAKLIESSVADAIERSKKEAHAEMIDRATETVEGAAMALKRYGDKEAAGERAVLREARVESLTTAAVDLVDYTFPADTQKAQAISDVAAEIRGVAEEGVDSLKENEAARNQAAARLASIRARLESMRDWC